MYTLLMRMVGFPTIESAFALAVATTLAWKRGSALHHYITIGAATTVTLYVVQINDPIDRIVSWLDELQVGQTSLARLVGASVVRDYRPTEGVELNNDTITMNDVRYAYRPGFDVLNGLSLTIRPGNDWPSSVPGRRQVDHRATARRHRRAEERLGDGGRRRAGQHAAADVATRRGR